MSELNWKERIKTLEARRALKKDKGFRRFCELLASLDVELSSDLAYERTVTRELLQVELRITRAEAERMMNVADKVGACRFVRCYRDAPTRIVFPDKPRDVGEYLMSLVEDKASRIRRDSRSALPVPGIVVAQASQAASLGLPFVVQIATNGGASHEAAAWLRRLADAYEPR